MERERGRLVLPRFEVRKSGPQRLCGPRSGEADADGLRRDGEPELGDAAGRLRRALEVLLEAFDVRRLRGGGSAHAVASSGGAG